MKRATKAEIFRHAYLVFAREIWPHNPDSGHIATLLLATDYDVLFTFDEVETITALFSDGSQAIVYPEPLQ